MVLAELIRVNYNWRQWALEAEAPLQSMMPSVTFINQIFDNGFVIRVKFVNFSLR